MPDDNITPLKLTTKGHKRNTKGRYELLHENQRKLIVALLRDTEEDLSILEISRRLKMRRPTVALRLSELDKAGRIRSVPVQFKYRAVMIKEE